MSESERDLILEAERNARIIAKPVQIKITQFTSYNDIDETSLNVEDPHPKDNFDNDNSDNDSIVDVLEGSFNPDLESTRIQTPRHSSKLKSKSPIFHSLSTESNQIVLLIHSLTSSSSFRP